MHARTGTIHASPDKIDDVLRQVEQETVPRYRDQSGYKGFTLLADRQSGKMIGVSFWESESDLEASDELGKQARESAAQTGEGSGDTVREVFEVLFDDMV